MKGHTILQSMKCHTISLSDRFWSLRHLIHLRLFIFLPFWLSQWHYLLEILYDFTVTKLCLRPAIFPNQSFQIVPDPVHRDQGGHCRGRIAVDVNWGKDLGEDLFKSVGCFGKSSSTAVLYLDMLAHIYMFEEIYFIGFLLSLLYWNKQKYFLTQFKSYILELILIKKILNQIRIINQFIKFKMSIMLNLSLVFK
jgi:hypothetical protein